jgi:hypothetical protein
MPSIRCGASFLAMMAGSLAAQAPQHAVIPAAYATNDAVSYQWIAGASRDVRQQTLIAPSHLTALVGHSLLAIELRRTAANEVYQGGTANLTVTLSVSPNDPLSCSSQFAANVGTAPVQVFTGSVTLPTSPAAAGPAVPWSPDNVMRIAFQVPFVYTGGTLCVDVIGHPVSGQNANWWMADAEFEDIKGTMTDLGGGCGTYGGPQKQWSHVATRSLVAGGHSQFFAYGPPWSVGIAAFGAGTTTGVPLNLLGLPAPAGCDLHLGAITLLELALFEPETHPSLLSRGGRAELRLPFPNDPSFIALTFTTQWVEVGQWWTSNAIEWTTSASVPLLGMALVEGHPNEPAGEVSVHLAHVMRFEYQ